MLDQETCLEALTVLEALNKDIILIEKILDFKSNQISHEIGLENRVKINSEKKLLQIVDNLMNEYILLQSRLLRAKGRIVSFGFIGAIKINLPESLSDTPSYQEIKIFIEKVYQAIIFDYGEGGEPSQLFEEVITKTKKLALAVGLSIKLKILDETLKVYPLNDLSNREEEFLKLKLLFETASQEFYVNLGAKNMHPLNVIIWSRLSHDINRDLKVLMVFSEKFHKLNESIDRAKIEADLPSETHLKETETLIDEKLAHVQSSKHPGVRLEFKKIKDRINDLKKDKVELAKQDFSNYYQQFEDWEKETNLIERDFLNKGISAFPWRFLPPSLKDIKALQSDIENKKKLYEDWPCTQSVISKKVFKLPNYDRLICLMNETSIDRINKALSNPKFSIKDIQYYIKIYKQLLFKSGDLEAEIKISAIELKLFSFAHKQQRSTQWFGFFTRSYFDNLSVISWADVAANLKGFNFGYSGSRTSQVLKDLGWFKEGKFCSSAPSEIQEEFEALQIDENFIKN